MQVPNSIGTRSRQLPDVSALAAAERYLVENGYAPSPLAKQHAIDFTIAESVGALTKTITVDRAGNVAKSGKVSFYRGRALRRKLTGTPTEILEHFAETLKAVAPKEAIICSPPPAGGDEQLVVTKDEMSDNPDAITRTKDYFRPPHGPALFAMDFDTAEFSPDLRDRIKEAGNVSNALAAVYPPYAAAACVRRASASCGIRLKGDSREPAASGHHRYYVVDNGQDIERFATILADRLMLAGYLWGMITAAGTVLPRTLFDVTASQDTSRLVYEADAILADDRLMYEPGVRNPVVTPGGLLHTGQIAPLTDAERDHLDANIAELKRRLEPQAAEQRKRWQERRVAEQIAKGCDPETAKRIVTGAVERHELSGDFEIQLDSGGVVTIRDILAAPAKFHKKTGADPLEPDYNGGHNIAIIYADRHPVRIRSLAHGGIDYALWPLPEDHFDVVEDEAEAEAPRATADWPEPFDIFGDESPAELAEPPAGALPDIIDRWSRSEARRKGVSPAFAAASAMTVCAAAIGSSLTIRPRLHDDGWAEPACLWAALVAEPGRAKSPTINAAVRPLRDLDAKRWTADKAGHDAWAARAKKKGALAPDPGAEPRIRRCLVDDATLEKQARIHADNPRGLLRAPDELVALLGSLGAYKSGPDADRGQMLKLFDGGELLIDRVGSGSIRAEHALMSVVASTQPEKIARLTRDLGSDGMLQRFLFVVDDGADRRGIDEEPDRVAQRDYMQMVRGLAEAEYLFPDPVRLSDEAYRVLAEAGEQIKALSYVPGAAPAWKGHVEKWGKLLPRITLVFYAIEQWSLLESVDPSIAVDASIARKAVLFARFLLRHSLRFYETYFGASEQVSEARWLAGHILTKPDLAELTRRTVYDARTNLRGDTRKLLSVMQELEAAGWVEVAARDEHGPKRWKVNPKVHVRFHQRGEWERADRERRREHIRRAGESRKTWLNQDNLSVGGPK